MPEEANTARTQVVFDLQDKVGELVSGGAASQDRRQNAHNQMMPDSELHRQLHAFPSFKDSGTSSTCKNVVNTCDVCKRQVSSASEAFKCICGAICHEYCAYPSLFVIPEDMTCFCLSCQAFSNVQPSVGREPVLKLRLRMCTKCPGKEGFVPLRCCLEQICGLMLEMPTSLALVVHA